MTSLGPVVLDIDGLELSKIDKEVLIHPQVGGLILFSRNYEEPKQLSELVQQVRELRPNLLLCVDQEGGRVQRFREGFSTLPCLQKLGFLYSHDVEQARFSAKELGWLMAAEVTTYDIDLSFAPVLDVDDTNSIIIGDRSFSIDPDVCVDLAAAYIQGMNEAGMKATGKHFPGHGGVVEDSHLELPIDARSYNEVEVRDLSVFKRLSAKLDAIMPAHIVFSEIDEHAVGFSKYWLQDVLRDRLEFNGVIFSDDLTMEGAACVGGFKDRAELALSAGCDSILVCNRRHEAERVLEFLESRNDLWRESNLGRLIHGKKITQDLQSSKRWQKAQSIIESLS